MEKPIITWSVFETLDGEQQFVQQNVNYADKSYTAEDMYIKRIQVWNNRSGNEDRMDAENASLILFFQNYEDSFLLNLCKIKLQDSPEAENLLIDTDKGKFNIGTISGRSNNGLSGNKSNYKEFELQFGPIPHNMRSELKSLIIDLEYN